MENLLKKNKLKRLFTLSSDEIVANYGYENIVEDIESRERFMMMEKILSNLPIKQKQVFIMRNYDDLSYEEISNITGKSIGTLKANYFHAFRKMKRKHRWLMLIAAATIWVLILFPWLPNRSASTTTCIVIDVEPTLIVSA